MIPLCVSAITAELTKWAQAEFKYLFKIMEIKKIKHSRIINIKSKAFRKEKKNNKKASQDNTSLLISFLAICISLLTLYFQFFYEKYHLLASVVDGTFENDSILTAKVIYHNKGNQHSTIVSNTVIFYQDSTDIENKGFYFSPTEVIHSTEDNYEPIVLTPSQQIYRDINQPVNFKGINSKLLNIDPYNAIRIGIKFGFINNNGMHSTSIVPIGWLSLDSTFQIKKWNIDFTSQNLESDSYYSGRYTTKQ